MKTAVEIGATAVDDRGGVAEGRTVARSNHRLDPFVRRWNADGAAFERFKENRRSLATDTGAIMKEIHL